MDHNLREKNPTSTNDDMYRWIGSFFGAILGACAACLVLYAIGFDSIAMISISAVCGLIVGAIAGYRLPAVSDAIVWIISLFA
jgi:Na+/phosphate symporter